MADLETPTGGFPRPQGTLSQGSNSQGSNSQGPHSHAPHSRRDESKGKSAKISRNVKDFDLDGAEYGSDDDILSLAAGTVAFGQEPRRPIRALLRGLEALQALNRRGAMTVAELAETTRLPRTTVYRILDTLALGGYAVRDGADERYRPGRMVRALAQGFVDDAWVGETAIPLMEAFTRRHLWALSLYVLEGGRRVLRATTDQQSPVAIQRCSPGDSWELDDSAPSLALLASQNVDDALTRNHLFEAVSSGWRRAVDETARLGYALDQRVVEGECSLALPVLDLQGRVRAAIGMRYVKRALSSDRVIVELLPELVSLTRQISHRLPEL